MKKFWKWEKTKAIVKNQNKPDEEEKEEEVVTSRELHLNGAIAEESWFDDDVTPNIFRDELNADSGDITVWINSPGGDCFAAAQIYNMLQEYPGNVTVKIDGIAASAASVIAMAGKTVLMSPAAILMIHNPSTFAFGETKDMEKAIQMLAEVKESIINAYQIKSNMTRAKISHLMDDETWMNANKAVELGLADDILYDTKKDEEEKEQDEEPFTYSAKHTENALINKISQKYKPKAKEEPMPEVIAKKPEGFPVENLYSRLNLISH